MKNNFWTLSVLIWLLGVEIVGADDREILGAATLTIESNVMIIFDTSASMAIQDVPANPYNKDTDYTDGGGGYEKNTVYRWKNDENGGGWSELVQWDLLEKTCIAAGLGDALDGNGQAWGRINTNPPYDCGEKYDELDLRTGNFLNYESGGHAGPMRTRLDVAKEAVKELIEDHPDVRFGLMRFGESDGRPESDTKGGKLSDNGDINQKPTPAQLKADIDIFTAEGDSPLAETLAEAGLYFAGQASWFHHLTYTSPIDIKCRPNAIILMTDGDSTKDRDPRLSQHNAYINNGTIGDYDDDGNDPGLYDFGGSDYLDDVAAFLYENDLMPDMGAGDPLYEKQNIVTHTIGFKNTHKLLRETAANGGGMYFTAGSTAGLFRVLEKIVATIENGQQVLVTPSIPASRANSVYAGNYLYLGLFKADLKRGRWRGNLKKYKLDAFGGLIDQNSRPATDLDGMFLTSAHSFWSEEADGSAVDRGGAGAFLVNNTSRNLYTYTGGPDKNLTADINAFSISNKDNIALTDLGVEDDDERQSVISFMYGVGREWVMADVLHSQPTVVHYDTNGDKKLEADDDALIYVGTNGGVMHAFLDSSGEELWGFIPPKQLGRLKRLSKEGGGHEYFIDGPPVVIDYTTDKVSQKALVFGERRGGSNYYVLDITSYDNPIWKYCIDDGILGEGTEQLGQSWGRPQFAIIATGPHSTAQVLLLPGGYDTHQDAAEPTDRDAKGRAVFSVNVDSGMPGTFKFYNDGQASDMIHCIVDLTGVDTDGDGIVNSIYAPDLGGKMFAFTDGDLDGVWRKLTLFDASSDTHRKIFFSPDVIRIIGDPDSEDNKEEKRIGEMIFFGTGDRAHPQETRCTNRFYAVKNYWWDEGFTTMTDRIGAGGHGDLHDATGNPILQAETLEDQLKASDEIEKRMGWFIDLETTGEKVVSTPVVYNRTVYFTTYVPSASSGGANNDDCDIEGATTGEARLYGLDYKDGRAVHDDWSDVKEYDPVTREKIKSGGKADRYKIIGRTLPSPPVIAVREGMAMLYVGVGGKLMAMVPKQAMEMNMYYWREIKP